MTRISQGLLLLALALGLCAPARAQSINAATTNGSVTIAAGNTFQTVLSALTPPALRRSLTIQNNNANTDNCWLYVGSGSPTEANSILLTPGLPYQRYFPYVPSDAIQATCASTGDSLYVDTQ